jgi:hypothetical protein
MTENPSLPHPELTIFLLPIPPIVHTSPVIYHVIIVPLLCVLRIMVCSFLRVETSVVVCLYFNIIFSPLSIPLLGQYALSFVSWTVMGARVDEDVHDRLCED